VVVALAAQLGEYPSHFTSCCHCGPSGKVGTRRKSIGDTNDSVRAEVFEACETRSNSLAA
jgi:hypothetical protein